MDTTIWGPPFWFILHTISFNYPDKPKYIEKQQTLMFFESLKNILPCMICKEHYKKFMKQNPISPYLDNKKSLINWVLELHNHANVITGEKIWTLEELQNHYNNIYQNREKFKCQFIKKKDRPKKFKYNSFSYIIIFILLIIFLYFIFFNSNNIVYDK